jgi:hypothetical protein
MSSTIASSKLASSCVALPDRFLNAYELSFKARNPWRVSLYSAEPVDGGEIGHEERGSTKNAVWEFRKANKAACPGPHFFVLDVNADTVAVPTSWQIPDGAEVSGYRFVPIQEITVSLDDPEHDPIVRGLLREAFKRAFKANLGGSLGSLWQNYNDFCQIPVPAPNDGFLFCRQFGVDVVALKGRRWCAQVRLSTQTVDGLTFADYARLNELHTLADWIGLKRKNRFTRKNRPVDVATLRLQQIADEWVAERLELDDADELIRTCNVVAAGNRRNWPSTVTCKSFSKGRVEVPTEQLRLILDTQITQEDHRETIIEPGERVALADSVRDLLDQTEVFGNVVSIAARPVDLGKSPGGLIGPPAVRIRESKGEGVLLAPERVDERSLGRRGRERSDYLKRFGLLQHRPLNPLLACPASRFDQRRAERLLHDMNEILNDQRLPFRFGRFELYRDSHEIEKAVMTGGFDSALVVLPEGRNSSQTSHSLHEQVKQTLGVPSQCIQYDNTFYDRSGGYSIPRGAGEGGGGISRRTRDHYVNCIWGLAVKNHYIPFAPAEPFHYNVHVAIDVGGRDNNKAMICIGYGLQSPRERLVFLAEELPVSGAKAEPIPVPALAAGIISALRKLASGLDAAGRGFDVTRVLFLRDGSMLGDAERWNERDALGPVLEEAETQGWLNGSRLWTIAEVSKTAEGWRPLSKNGAISNPLVGQWVAPFDDPNRVILSTTGSPYLTQGTASPLLVQVGDYLGESKREDVLRDIVWEADMCFTKPDMGMKLPWVLYVANEGALQAARSYEITGVPV